MNKLINRSNNYHSARNNCYNKNSNPPNKTRSLRLCCILHSLVIRSWTNTNNSISNDKQPYKFGTFAP